MRRVQRIVSLHICLGKQVFRDMQFHWPKTFNRSLAPWLRHQDADFSQVFFP